MSENNSEYILVDNAEKMQLVLASLASSSKIAIDTEFVRISTLHPIVALVQLNDGVNTFLVDPIILPPEQMELFWNHLTESETLLIFFAMHEDLDLIKFYSGRLPKRVVDLQWMAGFMGLSPKLGLASLVEKILGITILKDQTTSIWMQRPLTPDQLRYGAVDGCSINLKNLVMMIISSRICNYRLKLRWYRLIPVLAILNITLTVLPLLKLPS